MERHGTRGVVCSLAGLLVCLAVGPAAPAFGQTQPPQPPTITVQPQGQFVAPDTDVTLRVLASGTGPLRYQWYLNGGALADETNNSLVLPRLQIGDGGSFSAGVFNNFGAVRSQPAVIVVRAATGPIGADAFRDRPMLDAEDGVVQGDSSLASVEPREPVALGGGKSIWYEWLAPAAGIVTFSTRGSAFDTMLSVFTGGDLGELQLVTRGNDEENFYTSSVRFNARPRTVYQIAVDGFGFDGAGGQFTLGWKLEATAETAPVITTNPVSQAVLPGSDALFEVITDSSFDSFQWFLNGAAIRGATSAVHKIMNARSADVGQYRVRVTSRSGQVIESAPADLQLSSEAGLFVHDKIENVFFAEANANRPAAGFHSIGLGGTVISNEFFSHGGGGPADPFPCNEPFVGTLWLGLTATNTGVIQVDTTGSAISNRLAVYRLTGGNSDFQNPPAIVCDVTSGPAGLPCITTFAATNLTNYTVVVEGYKGSGNLKLTCRMGIAPAINAVTQCVAVIAGGTLQLDMPATNWVPVPYCQWRRNDQNILNETNTTLTIPNFSAAQAGSYSVVMSNFVKAATNTVATVVLADAFALDYSLATNNGNVGFVISGAAGHAFVLERAVTVDGVWTPLITNESPCAMLTFTNANMLIDTHRFFRAVAWP